MILWFKIVWAKRKRGATGQFFYLTVQPISIFTLAHLTYVQEKSNATAGVMRNRKTLNMARGQKASHDIFFF